MLRVAVVGASGYTGGELIRLLCGHPAATLTVATSRQHQGQPLQRVFPHLAGCTDIICTNPPAAEVGAAADLVFCAVPHKTAMAIVPAFLETGAKVVDLSADFRLRSQAIYETWYQEHTAPHLLESAVYGLPEIYRELIGTAALVANPGCYPTSITLALAPLLGTDLIDAGSIIADSKSGTSGAGRTISPETSFCEVTDGFRPYKVGGTHRHLPEIEQNLSALAGRPVTVSFTPHLLPISRGILSTVYAGLRSALTGAELHELYERFYRNERFVRVLEPGMQPSTQHVRGSNYCDIGVAVDERAGRVIVTAALDNIVKGASGQAIQNMNLMAGLAEDSGLTGAPLFP